MNAMTPTTTAPIVHTKDGEVFANNRDVAALFGKLHKNVLQSIRALTLSEPRTGLSFQPSEYVDASGKRNATMDMTRDGFTLLAMGFNGKKAIKFKLAYIEALNAMEEELRRKGPDVPDFNDPVAAARAWADEMERKRIAQEEVAKLEPVAKVGKLIASRKRSIMEIAGKLPGVRRNKVDTLS
jgi:Rha family phage regulatory protein